MKNKENTTIPCEVCGKHFKGSYEDYRCCDGRECGCMGMPTELIVCSLWCLCYAYHIRQGYFSVLKNYLHTLWINTKIGRKIDNYRSMKRFKSWNNKIQ